jgi:hypothetical protein
VTVMAAQEIHRRVLRKLSDASLQLSESLAAPWRWTEPHANQDGPDLVSGDVAVIVVSVRDEYAVEVRDADAAVIVALRNSAAAVLRGRRRIIERHRPDLERFSGIGVLCAYCSVRGAKVAFPCEDYRDAAADWMPEAIGEWWP